MRPSWEPEYLCFRSSSPPPAGFVRGIGIHGPPRKGIDERKSRVFSPVILSSCTLKTPKRNMKLKTIRQGFFLAVLANTCLFPSVSSAATIVIGSGPDSSYFVLESPNLGTRIYEVHYTYSAETFQDGFTLLKQVLSSVPLISAGLINYGTVSQPNLIVDSFTFNSVTETSTSSSPYVPYWAHWVSGGAAGYPSASPTVSGTWSSGSGISSPYRLIAPGTWDALFYSDGSTLPTVASVPETSSVLLGAIGLLMLFKRRRNS